MKDLNVQWKHFRPNEEAPWLVSEELKSKVSKMRKEWKNSDDDAKKTVAVWLDELQKLGESGDEKDMKEFQKKFPIYALETIDALDDEDEEELALQDLTMQWKMFSPEGIVPVYPVVS